MEIFKRLGRVQTDKNDKSLAYEFSSNNYVLCCIAGLAL
jgi:uncharacterized protein YkuJ